MTELIYHVAVTADNFIAGPNGEADDSIFLHDGDLVADFLESVSQYEAVLMGKNTYEFGFQHGFKAGEPSGVAQAANPNIKHFIFSCSMNFESNEKVVLISDDAAEFIKKIKDAEIYKKIWLCGGGQLAKTLLETELIDTLILKVNPVLIGEGIPLFGNSRKKVNLDLNDIKRYDSGASLQSYRILYP